MTEREKQLEKLLAASNEKLAGRDAEIKLLRQKIDLLIRRVFGASSEKLDPAQLELLLSGEEPGKSEASPANAAPPEEAKPKDERRRRRKEPPLPEGLPVLVTSVITPDAVKADPEAWIKIGEDH